jgi:myo-inositol-1(or 4)-monophosphatase
MPESESESLKDLLDTACAVAKKAGRLLHAHFHEARSVEFKGGIDLVTDADRMSEACVLREIKARHPGHAILSEEAGLAVEGSSGYRWVVDPLDGTTNYAHHLPHFSVSIAVESAGRVLAGAVYDPMRDELFSAARGLGATLNGERIRPSAASDLLRSLLVTGFPYDVREQPHKPVGLLVHMLGKAQGIRRLGSAALDLAYVASGRLDGYFEFGLKPWDLAAGAIIVEEAGGAISGIDGQSWRLNQGDVLASAPGVAQALVAESRYFLAELKPDG